MLRSKTLRRRRRVSKISNKSISVERKLLSGCQGLKTTRDTASNIGGRPSPTIALPEIPQVYFNSTKSTLKALNQLQNLADWFGDDFVSVSEGDGVAQVYNRALNKAQGLIGSVDSDFKCTDVVLEEDALEVLKVISKDIHDDYIQVDSNLSSLEVIELIINKLSKETGAILDVEHSVFNIPLEQFSDKLFGAELIDNYDTHCYNIFNIVKEITDRGNYYDLARAILFTLNKSGYPFFTYDEENYDSYENYLLSSILIDCEENFDEDEDSDNSDFKKAIIRGDELLSKAFESISDLTQEQAVYILKNSKATSEGWENKRVTGYKLLKEVIKGFNLKNYDALDDCEVVGFDDCIPSLGKHTIYCLEDEYVSDLDERISRHTTSYMDNTLTTPFKYAYSAKELINSPKIVLRETKYLEKNLQYLYQVLE